MAESRYSHRTSYGGAGDDFEYAGEIFTEEYSRARGDSVKSMRAQSRRVERQKNDIPAKAAASAYESEGHKANVPESRHRSRTVRKRTRSSNKPEDSGGAGQPPGSDTSVGRSSESVSPG